MPRASSAPTSAARPSSSACGSGRSSPVAPSAPSCVNWDPVLLTALSDLEVQAQEEDGQLWHVRYPLADGAGQLVVATTRPETILGDAAVAVHPEDPRYQELIGRQVLVPLGDRSGAVLEPYLTDQWFVKIAALAAPAIAAVEQGRTRFVPENWARTYFEWMRNIKDWCVSRQLWWGHRIPAWYDGDNNIYVGRDEAEVRARHRIGAGVALRQDEDVLDTWFSSALWPFSTLGWPDTTAALEPQAVPCRHRAPWDRRAALHLRRDRLPEPRHQLRPGSGRGLQQVLQQAVECRALRHHDPRGGHARG